MNKFLITKPGKHDISLQLNKEGEKLEWLGVIDARSIGVYELNLVMTHLVADTFGRVMIKGVAQNGARIRVKGLVKIDKKAQNADSFLAMKILLLDKKSSATVEPELEIEANWVKASHSASVGGVDEEQLLYLASRGVDRQKAKELIMKGFVNID